MRNVIPITCALTLAAVVAGVKVFRTSAEGARLVWYGNAAHPYIAEVRAGVEAFARETGVAVHCTVGQEWTQDNQNVNVEALSTQGYRGFSLYPGDPAGANALFRLLRARGQQVVAYGAEPALPTPASFTVATDIQAAARTATEALIGFMGGRGRILNVLEAVTDVNTRKRDEAIREVVARHPGVTIAQTIADMIQLGEATTKIQSALAARAAELDGIIATGFHPTVAAAAILTEWHKDPNRKRLRFVGIDTDATVLRAIREGAMDATVAQNPFGHGYVSSALLRLLDEGWTPRRPYQFIDAGLVLVTRENLDTYATEVRRVTTELVADLPAKYLDPPGSAMLELRGLDKSFPGVHALCDVSLRFAAGEIHGLVGENGAGKSTLMRLVTGLLEPDRGEVWLAGRRVRFRNARESMAAGIQLVQQEIQVIPESTVAENLMLDKLVTRGWGVLDWPAIHAQARKHLEVVGLPVPPVTIAKTLSAAQKRLLQIAKALAARTRLLLLDEPTSCLGPHETAGLHALLRELKAQGIALIYVTHKLEEVFALCDRVSVLRDGHHVGTHPVAGLDRERLVRLMVGREVRGDRVGLRPVSEAPEVLRVEGLTRRGRAYDISFTLHAGEILGCYGLVGSGRTETARLLIGDDRADAGRVWVRGQPVALRSVTENVRRWRVGYVSEDRKEEGLLLDFPVLANLTLTVWERLVNRWTRRIDPVRERGLGRHWVDALGIQCGSLENPVRNLSGGNQQKICLARWLAADCEILIIDEPTVGVDLGAKEQIHQVIRDLAAREGKAILLISSDMPEMIQLAHRILVFRDRRIVGEVVGGGASGQSAAEIGEAIGHWLN